MKHRLLASAALLVLRPAILNLDIAAPNVNSAGLDEVTSGRRSGE